MVGVDRNVTEAWAEIEAHGGETRFHQLDVTDGGAQNTVATETAKEFGRIDVLLTAAGVGDGGPVGMVEEEAWDKVIDINLKGTLFEADVIIYATGFETDRWHR